MRSNCSLKVAMRLAEKTVPTGVTAVRNQFFSVCNTVTRVFEHDGGSGGNVATEAKFSISC